MGSPDVPAPPPPPPPPQAPARMSDPAVQAARSQGMQQARGRGMASGTVKTGGALAGEGVGGGKTLLGT